MPLLLPVRAGAAGIGRVGEARDNGSRTRPYRPPPAAQPDLRLRRRATLTTTARWREGLAGEEITLKHRWEDCEMSNLSTPSVNGKAPRKTLAQQLDRLDT